MKKLSIIILFLLSLSVTAQTSSKTVYTTETGSKYHVGSCKYLAKSKIETTMEKAKSNGYTPCRVCKPGGGIIKNTKTAASDGRCTATTQKGTRCKRSAASGSSRCWQH